MTKTHAVWSRNAGPGVPSPVLDDGKLYWVGTTNSHVCRRSDGQDSVAKANRRRKRNITYASLTKANNVWLSMSQQAGTIAFRLKPEFEEVSVNQFAGDKTPFKCSFAAAKRRAVCSFGSVPVLHREERNGESRKRQNESSKSSLSDAFASIINRSGSPFQGRSANSVGPAQLLMTFDVNNDDKISPEELAESPMPKFVQSMMMKNGDKNKDGFIDAEERKRFRPR